MGQVSLYQGIFNFLLHCVAVLGALAACGSLPVLMPRWRAALIAVASFVAAFVAHIIAFIVLKALLGEGMLPEIHRPVVGLVWGSVSGLVVWLMQKRNSLGFWTTAFLTTCAYFVFVLLRTFLP